MLQRLVIGRPGETSKSLNSGIGRALGELHNEFVIKYGKWGTVEVTGAVDRSLETIHVPALVVMIQHLPDLGAGPRSFLRIRRA